MGDAKQVEVRRGRPFKTAVSQEMPRTIVMTSGKLTVELCPACGEQVRMKVYSVHGTLRYAVCPSCQRRLALRAQTIRCL